jgi:hypothetical protein
MNCDFATNNERDDIQNIIDTVLNYIQPCSVIIPLPLNQSHCGHTGTCVIDRLYFRNTLLNAIQLHEWERVSQLYYAWNEAIDQDEVLFSSINNNNIH